MEATHWTVIRVSQLKLEGQMWPTDILQIKFYWELAKFIH